MKLRIIAESQVPEPQNESEPAGSLDVVIVSFAPRAELPEVGLQRVFGIDASAAAKLVHALPRTVQRGVNRVRAEYFRKALELIGACVEVRDDQGAVVLPLTLGEAATLRPPTTREAHARSVQPVAELSAAAKHFAAPLAAAAAPAATIEAGVAAPGAPIENGAAGIVVSADGAGISLRAPAQPTLKEGVPTPELVHRPEIFGQPTLPAGADRAAIAQPAVKLPDSAFRFGNTNPPFRPVTNPAHARTAAAPVPVPHRELLAVPAAEPRLSAAEANGGMSWGDIDRSAPRAEPLRAAFLVEAMAETGPAKIELPASPVPVAVEAAASGHQPATFDIFESIPLAEPWRAPSQKEVAAERRKRAILTGDASVSVPEAVAPEMPMLGRWEHPEPESLAEPRRPQPWPLGSAEAVLSMPPSAAQSARSPARASARAAALAAPARRASDKPCASSEAASGSPETIDTRSFWQAAPAAFGFLALGHGVHWLSSIALFSLALGLSLAGIGSVPVLGFLVGCAAFTALFALCGDYHRGCFWAASTGEPGLRRGPQLEVTRILQVYLRSGVHLFGFLLLSHLPVLLWVLRHAVGLHPGLRFELLLSPTFWELAALSAWYWPMALMTASFHKDFLGVWDVALGARVMARMPLQYALIVLLGGAWFLVVWTVFLAIGLAAHLPPLFFSATFGIPLGLSHGLLGALSGHLMRTQPQAFE